LCEGKAERAAKAPDLAERADSGEEGDEEEEEEAQLALHEDEDEGDGQENMSLSFSPPAPAIAPKPAGRPLGSTKLRAPCSAGRRKRARDTRMWTLC
jgi:hypothetical protein